MTGSRPTAGGRTISRRRRARAKPVSRWLGATVAVGLALVVAACSGAGGTATPGPSAPGGSPTPGTTPVTPPAGPVATADEAAALVIASEARFADVRPYDPDLIGQAAWWTAEPATDGFIVTIRIGWGDCQAGCIDEHVWRYAVASDGTIRLLDEGGDEYPPGGADGTAGTGELSGRALAGPVCPVVQNPPDPACADRPVDGAVIVIRDASGTEVARVATAADGLFTLSLPAGTYVLDPQPVEGLMGTPAPVEVTVAPGGPPVVVELAYDTGIR